MGISFSLSYKWRTLLLYYSYRIFSFISLYIWFLMIEKREFLSFCRIALIEQAQKTLEKIFFFFSSFHISHIKNFLFFYFLFFFSLKEIFLCWYFTFIGARFRFIFHEILSEISKNWILKSAFLISMYERESLFEFNIFRIENDPSNPYHVKHIPKR